MNCKIEMYHEFQIRNFYSQIWWFDNNMTFYIDSMIESYLKTELLSTIDYYVFNNISSLHLAIKSFSFQYSKIRSLKIEIERLNKDFNEFYHSWLVRPKIFHHKWKEDDSLFKKLFEQRLKSKNFNRRVNLRLKELAKNRRS